MHQWLDRTLYWSVREHIQAKALWAQPQLPECSRSTDHPEQPYLGPEEEQHQLHQQMGGGYKKQFIQPLLHLKTCNAIITKLIHNT